MPTIAFEGRHCSGQERTRKISSEKNLVLTLLTGLFAEIAKKVVNC
ncbi:MAG: hypothetical protein CM15mP91_0860 [Chloroflexota bacterium]|nr:MAG: hypothetical protein CM15mP91_0860 [Chloroflexota bacterium]